MVKFFQKSIHISGLSKKIDTEPPPERANNDIVSFSKNSRRRMIKLISTLQFFDYKATFFVTLTYHEDYKQDPRSPKKDLDKYLKRILRQYSFCDYIWRLEEQKRGAPHLHILFLFKEKISSDDKKNLIQLFTSAWIAIKNCKCHYCRRYGVDVCPIESMSKLVSYVCKYSAKEDLKKPEHLIGRRWGHSLSLLQEPIDVFYFSKPAYRVFFQLLINQISDESRDLSYLKSLSNHDQDYFLFCSASGALGYLFKYANRFQTTWINSHYYISLRDSS
jgi:hypothetical protein